MRCRSAKFAELLTFLSRAAKIAFFSSKALPQFLFNTRKSSFAKPVVMSVRAAAPGLVMEKYSSSSRRTIMACLDRSGF